MIKGKRGHYEGSLKNHYEVGDWVMVHGGSDSQRVAHILKVGVLSCELRFYINETWTEIESGLENVEVTYVEHNVPITSIAFTIPEDVAKNLLLLQGVEL